MASARSLLARVIAGLRCEFRRAAMEVSGQKLPFRVSELISGVLEAQKSPIAPQESSTAPCWEGARFAVTRSPRE
jgi:hypothetical protein